MQWYELFFKYWFFTYSGFGMNPIYTFTKSNLRLTDISSNNYGDKIGWSFSKLQIKYLKQVLVNPILTYSQIEGHPGRHKYQIQTQHFDAVSTNSNGFLEQNININITLYQRSPYWRKIWFWGKLNIRISYQFFMNSAVWEPCMRKEFIGNSFSSKETLGYTEG